MASKSLLILSLAVLLSITIFGVIPISAHDKKTWCVAKPSTDKKTLGEILNYTCSMIDCSMIKPEGSCYDPNSALSQASVAMNSYYHSRGRNSWNCYFNGSGLISYTDPSFGDCKYD